MAVKRIAGLTVLAAALAGCGGSSTTVGGTSSYGGDTMGMGMGPSQQVVSDGTKALKTGSAPQVTSGVNQFGFELFQKVTKEKPDANVCVSPVSVGAVLAMLYNGSAGETQKQIAQALKQSKLSADELNTANKNLQSVLSNIDPDKVQLNIANSIWMDSGEPISSDFVQKNQDYYHAKVSTLDFKAPESPGLINNWVKDSTKGKIPQIVSQIPSDARLYVINAVYFNGSWQSPFKKDQTQPRAFSLVDGSTEQVPMMTQTGSFGYFTTSDVNGVTMPYGSGRLEMLIAMPFGKVDMTALDKKLDQSLWNGWIKAIKQSQVQVTIPTFKSDFEVTLNDALKAIGLTNAFDPTKADFTAMINKGNGVVAPAQKLYLSEVKHKTAIDVNEQGTEAAAATSGQMKAAAILGSPTKFTADHPFFYAIRDTDTGAILFTGALMDPNPNPKPKDKATSGPKPSNP